jgi:hypothetical protein
MTNEQLDRIISDAGPMAVEALGEIRDGILEAVAGKLEEASERDSDSDTQKQIKLSIPLKLVIRLDTKEPKSSVVAATSRSWAAEVGELPPPKTGAERQKEYRLRRAGNKE